MTLMPWAGWGFGKTPCWLNKLSNSGDTLKIKILSHIRKFMSGWSNYPGIVTSFNMIEREMGNRGSKSNVLINQVNCLFLFSFLLLVIIIFVKEQRVDGSCCTGFGALPELW